MKSSTNLAVALLVWLAGLCGCSSAPDQQTDPADPALIQEEKDRQARMAEAETRLADPGRLLISLDQVLDRYLQYMLVGDPAGEGKNASKLRSYLEKTATEHFETLVHELDRPEFPRNRAIAAGAIGFSKNPLALDPLLNALNATEPDVLSNATFGLGILADARTPPELLARVIESSSQSSEIRGGAAWSMLQIQETVADAEPYLAIWARVLGGGLEANPPEVLVSAVRGLGLSRDAKYRGVVEPFVSHPTPLVRAAAAVALGRFRDREALPALIALIGPAESNQNVRLASRKALQALAGGEDHGYDVEEWKRAFQRDR
jgi:hypothetical protein